MSYVSRVKISPHIFTLDLISFKTYSSTCWRNSEEIGPTKNRGPTLLLYRSRCSFMQLNIMYKFSHIIMDEYKYTDAKSVVSWSINTFGDIYKLNLFISNVIMSTMVIFYHKWISWKIWLWNLLLLSNL